MGFDPEDQEIIRALTKLKETGENYPEEMLAARRRSYLKRMNEIGLGTSADTGMKQAAKQVKTPTIAPITSAILEAALVVAIIAETGAVAYFYRDKLADLFKTISASARVQEVTPLPVVTNSLEIQGVAPSPALPSATIIGTPSPTASSIPLTGTPIPGVVNENNNNSGGVNLLNSTPAPNNGNTSNGNNENGGNNGNNGHHYGQTPKPERTKENGNNPPPKQDNNQPSKNNNNAPPDNSGQPKNIKPTKEK